MALEAVKEAVIGLPNCYDDQDGACLLVPPSHRGFVVFEEDRRGCSSSWIFPPGFELLPWGILLVVYTLMFVWIFFGIAICSDIFVKGIEVITSLTKKVKRKDPESGEVIEVEEPAMNWVVANISLMAFGTSAPEVLLAIIEAILTINEVPGELGPSTIVGSAAYNFFAITAVCNLALPVGQFKKIQQFRVFLTTALWSLWAYIWMYIVYKVSSPGVIDVWEAFLTLAFFPMLILHAYFMDLAPWKKNKTAAWASKKQETSPGHFEEVAGPTNVIYQQRRAILHYRQLAMRSLAGERHAVDMVATLELEHGGHHARLSLKEEEDMRSISGRMVVQQKLEASIPRYATKIAFSSIHYSVLESSRCAKVVFRRFDGDHSLSCSVHFTTRDGTAVAGLDYEEQMGTIRFGPQEIEREIIIRIIDDDMSEPDVSFSVVITGVEGQDCHVVQQSVSVTIVDDDESGMIMFELPTFEVGREEGMASVPVLRKNGVDGDVSVEYITKPGSALAGADFQDVTGVLEFKSGESRGYIHIPLVLGKEAKMGVFKILLANPMGGAVLGRRTECRVLLTPGAPSNRPKPAPKGALMPMIREEGSEDGQPFNLWSAWAEQFKEAMVPDLDRHGEDVWTEMVLHYISVTFKVILSVVPPAPWLGGYPCMFGSLGMLVGIIAIMQEIAGVWGCTVGLSELITGMTLVSAGTSIPDAFVSRWAVLHDDGADTAMGNITGSNCVNVFMGLGLPWVLVSLYRYSQGVPYVVSSGPLGFTLMIYCIFFAVGFGILMFRRYLGGELGASTRATQVMLSVLYIGFWLLFLVLAGVADKGHIDLSQF